ncbi:CheC, inhibitor of MCP methylation [Halorubrum distributum JCM 9100]|uniref:CheC, inhibitor of MCP methylation n=6 Tax=Halorubrum distributum TaxID=29283 RepID=M0EQM4_9EURY|nr:MULTISPECIES: chemotaxis protein CheC [Halorubrum distributum group]ELZ31914.1 CheC, inhibitor of MCP methylation [Halorubrum terrestre JCM 10247]ELZ49197.1 CheC, inhibitor of MCP methylation [Halorubrum distributum JCM 9100]ELZ57741.1 CheC, inhibitor of MCP methylation [Halorubrum distributum JCM 10118]EMA59943.1 CheC, inhibitor of MCP methylation [Halorubrum litoreum JCM 13561]EMA70194.1 CheC, inhibitor of MCP methylation [Halorubrum arcis JCM 13916]
MRVDVRALGACNRLAERGAKQAAGALSDLTGTDLAVEVTGASVASGEDLAESFAGRESIGVSVGLRGGLDGEAVLAFDAANVDALLSLLPGGQSMERSAVTEVGNIALGGFLDGWANYLGKAIDMSPPRYFEADGAAVLPDGALAGDGVFLFESRLDATTTDLDFSIYMLPDSGPFRDLIVGKTAPAATAGGEADGGTASTAVPYESLSTFSSLAKKGSANAADNIAMMTGLETTVDVSRLRFVPLADVPAEVGTEPHAGTVFELQGEPSGYLAILFEESSAAAVADAMLPMEPDEPLGDMAQNALCELGNVMTSGFIDGWANVLGTSITHSPPEFVHDIGASTISPLVAKLSERQDYGFVIDTAIQTEGIQARCDVYALPDERELARALDRLSGP